METDSPSERLAANVRALRDARGMSVRDLSARLSELGRPLLPSGITKIEQGQRRVDVDDLVALAVALRVNPSRLLLPDTAGDAEVSLTPSVTVPAWAAWQWADAREPLPTRSEAEGYNTEAEAEDFQLYSRPADFRRQEQHALMRAVQALRARVLRVVIHATTAPEAMNRDALDTTLRSARLNLKRVADELDVIEEEAADRG